MVGRSRVAVLLVLILAVVSLVLGAVFIVEGTTVSGEIREELQAEKVTLGLPGEEDEGYIAGNVVDTTAELQAAQSVLLEHMRDSYGTYGDTERGSEERVSYLDGTTLMNSMYIAEMGFGVSTVIIVSGAFMVIAGLALGTISVCQLRLNK